MGTLRHSTLYEHGKMCRPLAPAIAAILCLGGTSECGDVRDHWKQLAFMTVLKIGSWGCNWVTIEHAFWLKYCHNKDRSSALFDYGVTYVGLGALFVDKLHDILDSRTLKTRRCYRILGLIASWYRDRFVPSSF